MKKNKVFFLLLCILLFMPLLGDFFADVFYVPIAIENRRILKDDYITSTGEFGIWRKPYNNLRGHYHTGIDFKNPGKKLGAIEPVYACANGIVFSIYSNRSSSYVIIEHNLRTGKKVYSTYTHISDVVVAIGDTVNHFTVIGSFIDHRNLDKWGEYLNHIHFEILKTIPKLAGIVNERKIYTSYTIDIIKKSELTNYFYDPKIFFVNR
ncbi:MAG: hypothetical protein COX48_01315 [bacterium (Candidatus Stahlbacteria) CG23_combo_of_CG06-09_8_20_14_all_34_7]|nr:MAG: hypothetical protein COX48_01315 [bacterium (Candidatus Stahlbacteria) CG23_combo_of_CG06-09_8_20_14_all_34_7]